MENTHVILLHRYNIETWKYKKSFIPQPVFRLEYWILFEHQGILMQDYTECILLKHKNCQKKWIYFCTHHYPPDYDNWQWLKLNDYMINNTHSDSF